MNEFFQNILKKIIFPFERHTLFLMILAGITIALADPKLRNLFRPTFGQTWISILIPFFLIFGIPALFSLVLSFYKKPTKTTTQLCLVAFGVIIYCFIENIAGWSRFVGNAAHTASFWENIKDLALLLFAVQSFFTFITLIVILLIRYYKKNLDVTMNFIDRPADILFILKIIIAILLPFTGIYLFHLGWVENLAYSTFFVANLTPRIKINP